MTTGYGPANRTAQWFYGAVTTSPMGGVDRIVWHTTEGNGWPAYDGGAKAPHYTARPDFTAQRMEWRQHFPETVNARALQNDAGGVQTNLQNAVQVEIVGTCDQDHPTAGWLHSWDLPSWALDGLADFAADLNRRHGVPLTAWQPFRAYSNATGVARENNGIRMTGAQWNAFSGHCGHQHVPENDHGDPGALPIGALLARAHQILNPPEVPEMSLPAVMVASGQTQQYLVDGNVKRKIVTGAVSTYLTGTVDLPFYDGVPAAVLSLWPTVAVDANGVGRDAASEALAAVNVVATQVSAVASTLSQVASGVQDDATAAQIAALAAQLATAVQALAALDSDDASTADIAELHDLVSEVHDVVVPPATTP
jgi:hypothetical protein